MHVIPGSESPVRNILQKPYLYFVYYAAKWLFFSHSGLSSKHSELRLMGFTWARAGVTVMDFPHLSHGVPLGMKHVTGRQRFGSAASQRLLQTTKVRKDPDECLLQAYTTARQRLLLSLVWKCTPHSPAKPPKAST